MPRAWDLALGNSENGRQVLGIHLLQGMLRRLLLDSLINMKTSNDFNCFPIISLSKIKTTGCSAKKQQLLTSFSAKRVSFVLAHGLLAPADYDGAACVRTAVSQRPEDAVLLTTRPIGIHQPRTRGLLAKRCSPCPLHHPNSTTKRYCKTQ